MPTSSSHKITDPVFVTGVGMLTSAGEGSAVLWEAVERKQSVTVNGFGELGETAEAIALNCAAQAMRMAGWSRLTAEDGFVLATTTAQAPLWEKELLTLLKQGHGVALSLALKKIPLGTLLEAVADRLEFRGARQLVTSACASGIQAIGLASTWLRTGKVKRCLVGGTETLCALTRNGFESLQLLSKTPCKPFDASRGGINLSEGGAFLCLEALEPARPLGRLLGHGASLDAYHMTSPHPEGLVSARAMQKALAMAGLASSQIDWIHAHGTGSLVNDRAEALAIQTVFSGGPIPPVTSTKGTHGHFLGATGIVEVALILESLKRQVALPTTGHVTGDPEMAIPVLAEPKRLTLNHVLKNVSGFGGTNAALVVSRP